MVEFETGNSIDLPRVLAIFGGLGLLGSVVLPFYQLTFIITIHATGLDQGEAIWAPLVLAGILAVLGGIGLGSKPPKIYTKVCLIFSMLALTIGGFNVFIDMQYYRETYGGGTFLPFEIGSGLVMAVFSAVAVIGAILMVFTNKAQEEDLLKKYL